jgi:hypothetical protein
VEPGPPYSVEMIGGQIFSALQYFIKVYQNLTNQIYCTTMVSGQYAAYPAYTSITRQHRAVGFTSGEPESSSPEWVPPEVVPPLA